MTEKEIEFVKTAFDAGPRDFTVVGIAMILTICQISGQDPEEFYNLYMQKRKEINSFVMKS